MSDAPSRVDEEAAAAIRRSQRLASQLHQLVATSIATAGTLDETRIIVAVATRACTLLDSDEALVRVSGPRGLLSALARRGASAHMIEADDDADSDRPSINEVDGPRLVRGWTCVPILESWNRARGLIAVRGGHATGSGDDEEILSLLAQMTASTIAEARLREGVRASEARWRALVDSAPIGIVESERHGAVHWWNRAAASALEWPIATDGASVAWDPRLAEQLASDWSHASHEISRTDITLELRGRQRTMRVSVAALESSPDARVLTVLDDVTDELEMQDELRLVRGGEIRAHLASSVAHDFNNLLTVITGYTEVLAQALDGESLQTVREIQATTRRAAQITQQLQSVGRTQVREATVVDVARLLESNAEVIERMVGPDIAVERHLVEGTGNVRVDADQFEQMVLNLIINARDAMPEGGTVRISLEPDNKDTVVLSVADTGKGMDADTLAQCFEPFFTTKGPFQGTGTGLAAARRLVEASGGTITAQSTLGEGTTFTVRLPATDEAAAPDALAAPSPRGDGATLLVAEDDEALRRLMVQVLRRAGYQVLEAENGEVALSVSDGEHLDALVSDIDMPILGGVELALSLQASTPRLPVLLVSGHAEASAARELTPRTSAFLAKPFKPSELVDQVNALLVRVRS